MALKCWVITPDGVGLVTDIVRNAGIAVANKSVLLLGAGGAARGVLLPLLSEQPARLVLANRTHAKALDLAYRFLPIKHSAGSASLPIWKIPSTS